MQEKVFNFIDQITDNQFKIWIASSNKKYNLKIYNLEKLSSQKVKKMYSSIV